MNLIKKIIRWCDKNDIDYQLFTRTSLERIRIKGKINVVLGCDYYWVNTEIVEDYNQAIRAIKKELFKTEFQKLKEWMYSPKNDFLDVSVKYKPFKHIRVMKNLKKIVAIREIKGKIVIDETVVARASQAIKLLEEE